MAKLQGQTFPVALIAVEFLQELILYHEHINSALSYFEDPLNYKFLMTRCIKKPLMINISKKNKLIATCEDYDKGHLSKEYNIKMKNLIMISKEGIYMRLLIIIMAL